MTETTIFTLKIKGVDLLLAEDNAGDAQQCLAELERAGLKVQADLVQSAHEFCARLAAKSYDVILADYSLPTGTALDLLELLEQMQKDIPFILLTGLPDEKSALDCLKAGAFDYVQKDRLGRLPVVVQRAIEARRWREERRSRRNSSRMGRLPRRRRRMAPPQAGDATAGCS